MDSRDFRVRVSARVHAFLRAGSLRLPNTLRLALHLYRMPPFQLVFFFCGGGCSGPWACHSVLADVSPGIGLSFESNAVLARLKKVCPSGLRLPAAAASTFSSLSPGAQPFPTRNGTKGLPPKLLLARLSRNVAP